MSPRYRVEVEGTDAQVRWSGPSGLDRTAELSAGESSMVIEVSAPPTVISEGPIAVSVEMVEDSEETEETEEDSDR